MQDVNNANKNSVVDQQKSEVSSSDVVPVSQQIESAQVTQQHPTNKPFNLLQVLKHTAISAGLALGAFIAFQTFLDSQKVVDSGFFIIAVAVFYIPIVAVSTFIIGCILLIFKNSFCLNRPKTARFIMYIPLLLAVVWILYQVFTFSCGKTSCN